MEFWRKYNTGAHVRVPMIKRGVVDFAVSADWTPAAGDVKVSKDGGAAANIGTLPIAVTMGNGAYWDFTISASELQCTQLTVTIVDSATKAVEDNAFDVFTFGNASAYLLVDPTDSVRFGLTALPNAAAEAAGGLYTRGSGAGQLNQQANGQVDVNVARWLNTAAATPNTAGVPLVDARTVSRVGTAQAGAAGNITLDAGASAVDNFYAGQLAYIVSGTGAGQHRVIASYTGSTKVAIVSRNWTTTPDNTSVFALIPGETDVEAWARGTPNALQSGRVDSYIGAVAAAVIAAGSFAANALDAVWSTATRVLTAGTNIVLAKGTGVTGFNDLAASAVENAVWDAVRSSHVAAGSFGQASQATRSKTAQAGASGSITLDASASGTDNFYTGQWIAIVAGTGANQIRQISAYVGSTKVASVSPNWATAPDNTSVFAIF